LWRFHRVHHTAEHLDWLAAHREHPLDNLWTRTIENLPLLLLGFPLVTIAGFVVFRGLWAVFIHSNCTLTPGPLRFLIGAPRLHHWHHAIDGGGRVNFANLSPLMDLCFGTYHDPGHFPGRLGIDEPHQRGYVSALLEPLVPVRSSLRR
jgi:sterol desaturase/sphingolipid hydroxylase (fatty acid hydroxylase superfamily)